MSGPLEITATLRRIVVTYDPVGDETVLEVHGEIDDGRELTMRATSKGDKVDKLASALERDGRFEVIRKE